MSRSWPLGHVGSVLMSVVAQALLYNYCVQVLLLSLLVMLLMAISGKSRLCMLDSVLDSIAGVELLMKVFTLRARWILLTSRYMLALNVTVPQMFYPLKYLLLQCLVNLKQSCNNIISTLIMSLYASYACLCIDSRMSPDLSRGTG
jgi:hypothetical protein